MGLMYVPDVAPVLAKVGLGNVPTREPPSVPTLEAAAPEPKSAASTSPFWDRMAPARTCPLVELVVMVVCPALRTVEAMNSALVLFGSVVVAEKTIVSSCSA